MLLSPELCVNELLQNAVYILGGITRPQFSATSGFIASLQLYSLDAASELAACSLPLTWPAHGFSYHFLVLLPLDFPLEFCIPASGWFLI